MGSRLIRISAIVLLASIGLLWIDASRGADGSDVVEIRAYPWPEGPGTFVAAPSPEVGLYVPLADIESAIPSSLPWRLPSWPCAAGGKLEVMLKDGRTLTYGPCGVPAPMEQLRSTLVRTAQAHGTRVNR